MSRGLFTPSHLALLQRIVSSFQEKDVAIRNGLTPEERVERGIVYNRKICNHRSIGITINTGKCTCFSNSSHIRA